jgi:molybdopterin/thiamine biosynthesis adenylyltransferase
VGVLSLSAPVAQSIASIQAMEVMGLVLDLGELFAGRLVLSNGNRMTFREFVIEKKEDYSVCSGL